MRLLKADYEKAKAGLEKAKEFIKTVEAWEAAVVRCGPQYKGLDVTHIDVNPDGSIADVKSKPMQLPQSAAKTA